MRQQQESQKKQTNIKVMKEGYANSKVGVDNALSGILPFPPNNPPPVLVKRRTSFQVVQHQYSTTQSKNTESVFERKLPSRN